jgi:hypothetical protein
VDNPGIVDANTNAVEINGVLRIDLTYKSFGVHSGSATLSGATGNAFVGGNYPQGVITGGSIKFQ